MLEKKNPFLIKYIDPKYRTRSLIRKLFKSVGCDSDLLIPIIEEQVSYHGSLDLPEPPPSGVNGSQILEDGFSLAFTSITWDRMILEMELKQIRQMLEKEPEFARFLYTPQD
jgi:hypothetical protein